jgi:cytochrome c
MPVRRVCAMIGLLAGLGGALAAGTGLPAPAAAQDNAYGGLPEGKNRVLVFGVCSGCHSVKLVMQQGMPRAKWDKTLDWMVEQQGMPQLDPETESAVLDYLARHFNTDHRPGGGQAADGTGAPSPYNTMQPMTPAQ